uniref:Sulfate transport system permease protein n=1 Tax=Sciadococcus taiwanensis TaxID=3028030 RepID=A0A9Y1I241_9RHOD|nr:sulfate transport system permease protein [Sciadococcus taiwanensis]
MFKCDIVCSLIQFQKIISQCYSSSLFIYPFYICFLILLTPISVLLWEGLSKIPYDFVEVAIHPIAISSYRITLFTALIATLINTLFGLILAWILVRYEFPGKKILDIAIDLPFALPTSVAGLTLSNIYGDKGIIGSIFNFYNIKLAFNFYGIIIAMVFVSLPFIVRTLQPVIQQIEKDIEEAAWALGASAWQTFWFIIFPPLIPAIFTGIALGFSRAVGEYGSVVIISSNIPYQDLTTSVLIAQKLEQYDYKGATIIGTVILLISFIILLVINLLQLWSKSHAK